MCSLIVVSAAVLLQISKLVWSIQCYECSDFPREPGSQDESLGSCPGTYVLFFCLVFVSKKYFSIEVFSFQVCVFKISRVLHEGVYSRVPNCSPGPNKSPGRTNYQNLISVLSQISVLGGSQSQI